MMRRSNGIFLWVSLFFSLCAIPQLVFHWLAPDTEAVFIIYLISTVLSLLSPIVVALGFLMSDRGEPFAYLIFILQICFIILALLLIVFDVSVRNAIFSLAIAVMVYLTIAGLAASALFLPTQPGTRPMDAPLENIHSPYCTHTDENSPNDK